MATFRTIKVSNSVDKVRWADQVWDILKEAYSRVEGGLLFRDKSELIIETSVWKMVVKKGHIVAVAIFKSKFGQKLVAMGVNSSMDKGFSKKALAFLLRSSLEKAWMELSEAAEVFVMKYCGGERFLIHHSEAVRYLNKTIETLDDGYHYMREIAGIKKTKILLGTPGYCR